MARVKIDFVLLDVLRSSRPLSLLIHSEGLLAFSYYRGRTGENLQRLQGRSPGAGGGSGSQAPSQRSPRGALHCPAPSSETMKGCQQDSQPKILLGAHPVGIWYLAHSQILAPRRKACVYYKPHSLYRPFGHREPLLTKGAGSPPET